MESLTWSCEHHEWTFKEDAPISGSFLVYPLMEGKGKFKSYGSNLWISSFNFAEVRARSSFNFL